MKVSDFILPFQTAPEITRHGICRVRVFVSPEGRCNKSALLSRTTDHGPWLPMSSVLQLTQQRCYSIRARCQPPRLHSGDFVLPAGVTLFAGVVLEVIPFARVRKGLQRRSHCVQQFRGIVRGRPPDCLSQSLRETDRSVPKCEVTPRRPRIFLLYDVLSPVISGEGYRAARTSASSLAPLRQEGMPNDRKGSEVSVRRMSEQLYAVGRDNPPQGIR
jgi:hypothetical protein